MARLDEPTWTHLVPRWPRPGTTLQAYPVVRLPEPRAKVKDKSVRWLYQNVGPEVWEPLAAGKHIRLLPKGGRADQWPPVERGWLSLAPLPGAEVVRQSVGVFRLHLYTNLEEIRLIGTTFGVSYGRVGRPDAEPSTRWPPGEVVAHLGYRRPECLEGVDLPVRVRWWRDELDQERWTILEAS